MQDNRNDDYKSQYDPTKKNDEPKAERNSEVKIKFSLGERAENFWYHYKWHTVIALFLVIAITIASVQMCTKTTYDMYIMYAGGADVKMTGYDGSSSDYERLHSSSLRYVSDVDGDGARNLSLLNLFLPSDEQIKEYQEAIGPNEEINYTLLSNNDTTFRECMLYGEFYICILSEHLLTEWTKNEDSIPFLPIADYLPEGAKFVTGSTSSAESGTYVLPSEYGVYLSSTPLAGKPGFDALGEDAVICIRMYSEISNRFSKKESLEHFRNSEEVLRRMLADEAYS